MMWQPWLQCQVLHLQHYVTRLRKIIDFEVVQITETTSSMSVEKEAFKRCIENYEEE